jgi:hypothetical protein
MMISWTDEQAATSLIEVMASKIITLEVRIETMLTPHKTAFLITGQPQKKIELEHNVREFQILCKKLWSDLNINENELEEATDRIEKVKESLVALGLSPDDLEILVRSEADRAKAVGTLVTAVALNEMRSFSTAEANRNLAPEARQAQRAMRFGLNLQQYVSDYLPLVQHQITLMGFKHDNAPKVRPVERGAALSCRDLYKISRSSGTQL